MGFRRGSLRVANLILTLVIPFFVSGCVNSTEGNSRQLKAPSYATRTGAEAYSITCGGGATITVRRTSLGDFYHKDGSEKSLFEFCREHDPATLIRKK